jgi:hypothetical protein
MFADDINVLISDSDERLFQKLFQTKTDRAAAN